MARVLALEPYYGGSHQAFLDGLIQRSRHTFHLLTLPARFWKWRMRGAAITLAEQANQITFNPDLILASDMLGLADFKALYRRRAPAVIYMHENQLSYPAHEASERDVHFGFTNLTSCLAADLALWNSQYHLESFLAALPGFIALMPDHRPEGLAETIRAKSAVIPPGLDLDAIDRVPRAPEPGPPLILWNHRWEFDKDPETFFAALAELDRDGIPFRLALLGQNPPAPAPAFLEARERYGPRILQFGYAPERSEYLAWLRRSAIAVSTARQENFGLAAAEAAYAGAFPLWPHRLSYPELLPAELAPAHLYRDFRELVIQLKQAAAGPAGLSRDADRRREAFRRFDLSRLIGDYDELIERAAAGGKEGTPIYES